MRYLKELTWEIIPQTTPKIKKTCSKCGQHALFQNSEKFRVNANKNKIDVWLIYQCEKCKTTWNMTIHERIAPKDIPNEEYEMFLSNDVTLARAYGFNKAVLSNNKVMVDYNSIAYEILGDSPERVVETVDDTIDSNEKVILIEILCEHPFNLRMEKVLSQKLGLSRANIKKLCQNLDISGVEGNSIIKEKIGKKSQIEMRLTSSIMD